MAGISADSAIQAIQELELLGDQAALIQVISYVTALPQAKFIMAERLEETNPS